jgi:2-polyprenyl-3-methyl-5-hydroxy-6-metoxy-1,4-benzoquinol methylase
MSSEPKLDAYPLARGVIDSVRLNLCHFIWKKSFPWVVHPSVSLEGRENLRIADVGCGTGLASLTSLSLASHQSELLADTN